MTLIDIESTMRRLKGLGVNVASKAAFNMGALDLLPSLRQPVETTRSGSSVGRLPFVVLLYHRINPFGDPFFPSTSVSAFNKQMRYLAENFHVLTLESLLSRIRSGQGVAPWSIVITFDDGYRDNYEYAEPILKKYGLGATIFVPTAYIDTSQTLWNDQLSWAIKHTRRNTVVLLCDGETRNFPLGVTLNKLNSLNLILELLKTFAEHEKQKAVETILDQLDDVQKMPQPLMLGWDELRALARGGWTVGSHTVNHSILTRIETTEARRELRVSKEIIEKQLQMTISLFAYPNGRETDFSSSIKQLVEETGYQGAVTTVDGFNNGEFDAFAIQRRSPWEENFEKFALRLRWSFWRAQRDAMRKGFN